MILYLAAVAGFKRLHPFILENCPNIGVLCTYASPKEFYSLVESGFKNIMLDSGAYTVSKKGITIDIANYAQFIKDNREKITVCVNLDVIGNPEKSYENWQYLRTNGADIVMPVYHLGEDVKWLDLYCKQRDFVGIGGIAGKVTDWKLYFPFLRRITDRYPNHKFHAFGLNSYRALRMVNVYSCDATTWLNGGKYAKAQAHGGELNLRQEPENSLIWEELAEWGVEYKDFIQNTHDYKQINKFNIKFLYDLLSNHTRIEVSEQEDLF